MKPQVIKHVIHMTCRNTIMLFYIIYRSILIVRLVQLFLNGHNLRCEYLFSTAYVGIIYTFSKRQA
uniref:Uncharacterized protein n=1 Tax=Anguilla anguilla TaxID=7936 RepID=A0A0E9T3Y1_ANGAN